MGRESPYGVYSASAASFNTADVGGGIEQNDATGVAKYHGFQSRLAGQVIDEAETPEAAADGGVSDEIGGD